MWSLKLFALDTHDLFAQASLPAFLFVVGAVACAAGLLFWPVEVIMVGFLRQKPSFSQGWCRQREKIDWQEPGKFDCRLVRTIFIFVVPRQFS